MLTFAVVAARPGQTVPPRVRAVLADPCPSALTFEPSAHVTWSSADDRVHVAAWQDPDRLGIGRRWEVRPSSFTAFGGLPTWGLTPWSQARPWAVQLADRLDGATPEQACRELAGNYAIVSMAANGDGTVAVEPLGLTPLYRAEGDHVVASNRPLLAAQLASSPPGSELPRDAEAMAWLVLMGEVHEARTGYRTVRRVPEGSYLTTAGGATLDVVTWDPRPWWPGPPVAAAEHPHVIAEAINALQEQMALHAQLPSHNRKMELTGGHDSRVLLAAALQAGVEHQFSYVTWGAPDLPDVVVAQSLAERYELDHDSPGQARPHHRPPPTGSGDPEPLPHAPRPGLADYEARVRYHVWATSGAMSIWDRVSPPGPPSDDVAISGLFGELLRPHHPAARRLRDERALMAALRGGWLRLDPGRMLLPDVRDELVGRLVDEVVAARGAGSTITDGLDGVYLRHRLRPWYGGQREHEQRNRCFPFVDLRVVRAAFALGPSARRAERLAFAAVQAADPALARLPFAGAGWPPEAVDGLPRAGDHPTSRVGGWWELPPRGLRPFREAAAATDRLVRHTIHALARPTTNVRDVDRLDDLERHRTFLRDLTDLGPGHRLYDIVDRRAVERAFRRSVAPEPARRALFDVATAAVWLDGGEARRP